MRRGGSSATREVKRSRNMRKPMIKSATMRSGLALADAGPDAPRQEFRVALDIRDQREKLLRRVGQHPLLGVGRHGELTHDRRTEPLTPALSQRESIENDTLSPGEGGARAAGAGG